WRAARPRSSRAVNNAVGRRVALHRGAGRAFDREPWSFGLRDTESSSIESVARSLPRVNCPEPGVSAAGTALADGEAQRRVAQADPALLHRHRPVALERAPAASVPGLRPGLVAQGSARPARHPVSLAGD